MKRAILAVAVLIAIATMLPCAAMAQATLTSDLPDYHPGQTVTLTGTSFQPGETVTLLLTDNPQTHGPVTWTAVADASGNFTDSSYVVQPSDENVTFTVTATGDMGSQAQTTFTDHDNADINAITGNGTIVDNQSTHLINCTGTGGTLTGTCTGASYSSGTAVTMTANAASGYTFSSWTNTGNITCVPSGNTCSFTAVSGSSNNVILAATFTASNQPPTITSAATTTFYTTGSFTVTATGSPAPTFSETGTLPSGITLNSTTGVLSGTATQTGVFPITITASNGNLPNAVQNFTLTVLPATQVVATGSNKSTGSSVTISSFTVPSTGLPPGDAYLVVGVSVGNGAVTSISWNGVTTGFASLGTAVTTGTGAGRRVDIWQLQNPAPGTYSIVVTTSAANGVAAGAVLLGGVATGGPASAFRTFTSALFNSGTTNPSVTAIPTNPGDVIIDTVATMSNPGTDTPGSGQTQRWFQANGTSYITGEGSTNPITSGTSGTMSWTLGSGSSYYCAMGAVSVIPYTPVASKRRGQTIVARLEPGRQRDAAIAMD